MADKDHRLKFLSGFTGGSGTIIVTKDHAYLRTDYANGAEADGNVDENWTVMIEGRTFFSYTLYWNLTITTRRQLSPWKINYLYSLFRDVPHTDRVKY